MESSKEPISLRIGRINSEILGRSSKKELNNISRESLLDTLQALYDECCIENLQKYDKNVDYFVEKYKQTINLLKHFRVNISDFDVKSVIGRGHFGEVHMVVEKQTGDVYAMKSIRKCDSLNQKRTSFIEEKNIMAFSQSPWLTSLQYSFQDPTHLFFIMEYHPGGDLLGLLSRQGGTVPESAATFYLAEIVLGLKDLHKMGYVHRDIKPDNILLDRCGHLKIADFGSAAKLNSEGFVTEGPPVGTPDYIAPEVLQSVEKNVGTSKYGVSCDFWSLGILAYELTIGSTPFAGQNATAVYSKIMNHADSLKFPSDAVLTQAYVQFVRGLVADRRKRLDQSAIVRHAVFRSTNFDTLRDQVPPFLPKLTSYDDTSNFVDVAAKKKKTPNMENFKKKIQFSGRNLPFIGFTFTPDPETFEINFDRSNTVKDEALVNLKTEMETLRKQLLKKDEILLEKESLERKLEEKSRKLEGVENVRNQLERDIANNIAECAALKRTLELERKDRTELERKALDLIKSAKQKWETSEKNKVNALTFEIDEQKDKIAQLTTINEMLNEQIQHALKMEAKQNQSMEIVDKLNRRSVIGLESRLDKVTVETQNTISELRSSLEEEIYKNNLFERQISKLKEKEKNLVIKLKNKEDNNEHLQERFLETEELIQDLNSKVIVLEQESTNADIYKEQVDALQQLVDDSQKMIKDLQNKNTMLEVENRSMESVKRELMELNNKVVALQNESKGINAVEDSLQKEKEKNLLLTKQIEELGNKNTDSQDLRELRTKLWRMEKEVNNSKIDKRIVERELKEAQALNTQLTAELEKLKTTIEDSRKSHEIALLEMNSINEQISVELIKSKQAYVALDERSRSDRARLDEEKTIVNELKSAVRIKDESIRTTNERVIEMERRARDLEEEKNRLMNVIDGLNKQQMTMSNELETSKTEMQNTKLNLAALREACVLLENQVVEFEKISAAYQDKNQALNENTEKLIADLCRAKTEIQEAKRAANEERSLKLVAETRSKRQAEDVECLQNECTSYKQQCFEYKQLSNELSDGLTAAEEKITDLEVTLKSYERQIEDLVAENNAVKEELSERITKVHELKSAKYRLNQQVNELTCNKRILVQKVEEMERLIQEKSAYYKEREVKSDATIKQQIKLIDYLQNKIDELTQKKKTFTDILFGHSKKENVPPVPMNYKDLETQLQKERNRNRILQEENYRLKTQEADSKNEEIMGHIAKVQRHKSELSPKMKVAMQQLVQSPASQKTEMNRQMSLDRMHHNIPHRFETKLCTRTAKCTQCSNPLLLGRHASVCRECSVTVHTNCVGQVPGTCGLPEAYAQHFKNTLGNGNNSEDDKNGRTNGHSQETVSIESWIKLPNKSNGWDKCYACLTESHIKVYSDHPEESTSVLLTSFELNADDTHGKVVMEPLASEIDVPVARDDLSFIMKVVVSPNTTCWPPKSLTFLTLSSQDKEKWFKALQSIFQDDPKESCFEKILTVPEDLSINCIYEVNDSIKILGTQKGLYSYYNGNLLHISGLDSVHHIASVPSTNTVLMIVDAKSVLISCDLNHLINVIQCTAAQTKPTLKFKSIDVKALNGFHILQTSTTDERKMFCVATPKQLIIFDHDMESNAFTPVRILDTAEPTSCVLFTEHSIIVGADKFFEIDIETFSAEEFLDSSDARLKQVLKCYRIGSFPLSVVEVSKHPKEYLISFNEFSVFVDEYGRTSRHSEIRSVHLPLVHRFLKPFLYTIQYTGIEILRITEQTCNNVDQSIENLSQSDCFSLNLDRFQFIGSTKRGVYICHKNSVKFLDARKVFTGGDVSIDSESTTTIDNPNDSDRFSFTSSMVRSLEGQDSDSEAVGPVRTVTFAQTNL